MIVTWIAIQSQPIPWEERRTDLAYVACGERAGELSLVRPEASASDPAVDRLLDSLERAISEKGGRPSLDWIWRAMPDQGTSIRLSSPRRCQAASYEEEIRRLAVQVCPSSD